MLGNFPSILKRGLICNIIAINITFETCAITNKIIPIFPNLLIANISTVKILVDSRKGRSSERFKQRYSIVRNIPIIIGKVSNTAAGCNPPKLADIRCSKPMSNLL